MTRALVVFAYLLACVATVVVARSLCLAMLACLCWGVALTVFPRPATNPKGPR